MCLQIKSYMTGKKSNKGYILAYKVIRNNNFNYYMTACDTQYIVGEMSAIRPIEKLTHLEIEEEAVHKGFHLISSLESARKLRIKTSRTINNIKDITKIIRVYYKPENVVSYGIFNYWDKKKLLYIKSVVVTRLLVKSLDPVE